MKITKRLAEEAYCFTELEFDSLEEYNKEYPKFAEAYILMKTKIEDVKAKLTPPFKG